MWQKARESGLRPHSLAERVFTLLFCDAGILPAVRFRDAAILPALLCAGRILAPALTVFLFARPKKKTRANKLPVSTSSDEVPLARLR
jgi:hypothetical protein